MNSSLKRSDIARDSKRITQFYLPSTHKPYLHLLPSRRPSPPFGCYTLRLPTERWPGWVDLGGWLYTEIDFSAPEVEPRTRGPRRVESWQYKESRCPITSLLGYSLYLCYHAKCFFIFPCVMMFYLFCCWLLNYLFIRSQTVRVFKIKGKSLSCVWRKTMCELGCISLSGVCQWVNERIHETWNITVYHNLDDARRYFFADQLWVPVALSLINATKRGNGIDT